VTSGRDFFGREIRISTTLDNPLSPTLIGGVSLMADGISRDSFKPGMSGMLGWICVHFVLQRVRVQSVALRNPA
jgi:hypothetical protein